jgi:hypothetical protein
MPTRPTTPTRSTTARSSARPAAWVRRPLRPPRPSRRLPRAVSLGAALHHGRGLRGARACVGKNRMLRLPLFACERASPAPGRRRLRRTCGRRRAILPRHGGGLRRREVAPLVRAGLIGHLALPMAGADARQIGLYGLGPCNQSRLPAAQLWPPRMANRGCSTAQRAIRCCPKSVHPRLFPPRGSLPPALPVRRGQPSE